MNEIDIECLFNNLAALRDLYKEYPKMVVKKGAIVRKDIYEENALNIPYDEELITVEMPEKTKEHLIGKIIADFERLEGQRNYELALDIHEREKGNS
jgi:hypothetical protein